MKKVFKKICLLICILLLELSTFALLLLIPLTSTLTKKNIKELMLNYQTELLEENTSSNNNIESLYKEGNSLGIEDETISKIMESEEVKELIADVTSDLVDYYITGKEKDTITKEDLKEVAESAIDQITEDGTYQITEEQKKEILNDIEGEADTYLQELENMKSLDNTLTEEEKEMLNLVRFLLSIKFKIYLIAIIIISLVGIVLLKWKNQQWIKASAITILTSSVMSFISTLLISVINTIAFKEEFSYLYSLFSRMVHKSLILSGSIFVTMIIILIIYHLIFVKKQKELATLSES